MRTKRLVLVIGLFLFPLLLLGLVLTHPAHLTVAAEAETAVSLSLAVISERTGWVAAFTATSSDCHYSHEYRIYLCPDAPPAVVSSPDPAAAARAREMLGTGGLLLIPDSGSDRVMAFDPQTGDLVYADFIPTDSVNLFTPKNAILSPAGDSILVADQVRDVVQAYDLSGQYLGVFAPAGGADPNIMDTITAATLRPDGNVLVAVTVGTNAHAVVEFDTAGNYLGNFVAAGSGGLASPFDVFQRTADWLVSGINSNAVHRYDLNNGSYIADLAAIDNFPEQVAQAGNGNVLVANFTGDQEGVVELTAAGGLVGVYNPLTVGGNRGIYELPNGHLLTTNGTGVYEIDRMGNVIDVKMVNVNAQYIEFVVVTEPNIRLDKTVGTDPQSCASTQVITVTAGTEVTYCYTITNTGLFSMTTHDLVDSELGVILSGTSYNLEPFASTFLTQSAFITSTTVNTATWTAYTSGGDPVTASDSATVVATEGVADINLNKTVGVDSHVCATTQAITVTVGTAVTYCYTVTNTGQTTLTLHSLVDSQFGDLLNDYPFSLTPAASTFLTVTAVITTSTINTATWTSHSIGGQIVTATDTAVVATVPIYSLYLPVVQRGD